MADTMFVQPDVNIGGKRKYTVFVSIVAHTLALAAVIIVPLAATDTIVIPQFAIAAFTTDRPLPPAPPPPPRAATEALPVERPAVPMEAPQGIAEEIPIHPAEPFIGVDPGLVPGIEYSAAPPSPPPAPVAPQAPVPVGGDIKRPMKVRDAAPVYPAFARTAHVQGVVIVQATIGPDGKVQDARVLRPVHRLLDDAALDAVRQWEYTPTLLNGTPIAIVMTVTVDFRLR